jgi:hypothetical protein
MPRDGVAQDAAPDQPPSPSLENDSLKDSRDSSVEQDSLPASQPMPLSENPVILKESEGRKSQEGIDDVFSKDQGDRFQSQSNKGVEFTTVK